MVRLLKPFILAVNCILALCLKLFKAQLDLNHVWEGRNKKNKWQQNILAPHDFTKGSFLIEFLLPA